MPSLGTEKAGGGDPALQETLVSPHRPGTLLAYVEIKASLALFFFLGKNSNRKGMKTKSSEKAASDERHVPMGRDAVREGESGPGPIRAPRGLGVGPPGLAVSSEPSVQESGRGTFAAALLCTARNSASVSPSVGLTQLTSE